MLDYFCNTIFCKITFLLLFLLIILMIILVPLNKNKKKEFMRKSPRKHHGIIFAFFYRIFGTIRWFTLRHLFIRFLPRVFDKECIYDHCKKKSKPWWQDLWILIHLGFAILLFYCSGYCSLGDTFWKDPFFLFAIYLVADIFVFDTNMFFFDDLEQTEEVKPLWWKGKCWDKMVWSHRRLLLQIVIDIVESVLLFAVLYKIFSTTSISIREAFQISFTAAFTLSFIEQFRNKVPWLLWAIQIVFSFYLIVLILTTLASIGFKRKEIADSDKD